MSNFLEDIETIKTFHTFLGIIINRVEKGEKVDFTSVRKLSEVINKYLETREDSSNTTTKHIDKFLDNILSDSYENTKKRNDDVSYNTFKNNLSYY
tara:strand:+ start:13804 stop:14091 length:288 start_codon:yes stop_codon:yes gene_type:complete